jgi:hypothetical protein
MSSSESAALCNVELLLRMVMSLLTLAIANKLLASLLRLPPTVTEGTVYERRTILCCLDGHWTNAEHALASCACSSALKYTCSSRIPSFRSATKHYMPARLEMLVQMACALDIEESMIWGAVANRFQSWLQRCVQQSVMALHHTAIRHTHTYMTSVTSVQSLAPSLAAT